jgi:hypothetical protein
MVQEAGFGFSCKLLIRSRLHHGIEFEQNGSPGMKRGYCWHGVGLIVKQKPMAAFEVR